MKHDSEFSVPIYNTFDSLSETSFLNESDCSNDHHSTAPSDESLIETVVYTTLSCDASSSASSGYESMPNVSNAHINNSEFVFKTKGLHMANLNIRHILPKLDELRIVMSSENGPDILGLCETFLNENIACNELTINGFEYLRKDRSFTIDKSGGGLILYFRNNINCKHRPEFEISKIETIWTEISLPNSKPFLLCTTYRPPDAKSNWIDLFEEELSAAQTSGLEIIFMGDINIDYKACSNSKWLNLIQLFDLSQLITDYTRVTKSTTTNCSCIYIKP